MMVSVEIEGRPETTGEYPTADFNLTGPGYFEALGVALVRGRDFSEADDVGAPPVVLVNQAFAARFFPGEDPLGRRLTGVGPLSAAEIVGVVADHRARHLRRPAAPAVFAPHAQLYQASLGLVARTAGDPQALLGDIRRTLRGLDPDMPLFASVTLREKVAATLGQERLLAVLFLAFGGLALVLAGSGLFGLAAYTTQGRTREIGLRVALGARPRDVLRLVLGQSLGLVAAGLTLGLALTVLAGRLLAAQLFGVRPSDPWNLLAVAGVLVLTALLASHLPARRALRVDPVTALRSE
jgi:putative ABC transport system permease protein